MSDFTHLDGMDGEISRIYKNRWAEVHFMNKGVSDWAFLADIHFYHRGKMLRPYEKLADYLRVGTAIKFSCHTINRPIPYPVTLDRQYKWYVDRAWVDDSNAAHNQVQRMQGRYSLKCTVQTVRNRSGVVAPTNPADRFYEITVQASKFYVAGRRLPSSKSLSSILAQGQDIYCDAVPCFREESKDNCSWFATCAFESNRPSLPQPDFLTPWPEEFPLAGSHVNYRALLLKIINVFTNYTRGLYTVGHGYVMEILDDEFMILLGCFKLNVFQTILAHRKNAFLFKNCLTTAKLSDIFMEGDRMRFIAVGAPLNFITDWIAVQVAVPDLPE